MPTYPYACTACDHRFEQVQAFSDPSLTECPACGGRLRKVFSLVGIVFKGSGFYRNDARAGASSSSESSGSAESKGTSESKSDAGAKSETGGGSDSGTKSDAGSTAASSSSSSTSGSTGSSSSSAKSA